MKEAFSAKPGDLILILSGPDAMKTRKQLCELRLEVGRQLGPVSYTHLTYRSGDGVSV